MKERKNGNGLGSAAPGTGARSRRYFLPAAAALAFVACCDVTSACFFWFAAFATDCFCDACFCTDFGDLSPMADFFRLSCLARGMLVSPRARCILSEVPGGGELRSAHRAALNSNAELYAVSMRNRTDFIGRSHSLFGGGPELARGRWVMLRGTAAAKVAPYNKLNRYSCDESDRRIFSDQTG